MKKSKVIIVLIMIILTLFSNVSCNNKRILKVQYDGEEFHAYFIFKTYDENNKLYYYISYTDKMVEGENYPFYCFESSNLVIITTVEELVATYDLRVKTKGSMATITYYTFSGGICSSDISVLENSFSKHEVSVPINSISISYISD